MCDLRPACCRNRGCKETLGMEDAEAHMRESCAYRAVGMCQQGCGLLLLHEDLVRGDHCCLSTLRSQNGVLRAKLAHLDLEAKEQKVRWDDRERDLLAQVRGMRREARLAALRYRHQLNQYMVLIRKVTQQVSGHVKGGDEAHVSVSLPRNKDSLTINDMSTMPCQENMGPEVSSRALQVNGKDLSKGSHDESAEMFHSAKDPIVVQVLRRSPVARGNGTSQEVHVVDVCTQTDITFEHIMALAKLRPLTPPVPDICPFLLSDSCHSLHTMDRDCYGGSDYLSNMVPDGERAEEFEYEEVELCRLNSQEKLGLTLCYRTDDEDDVGIYVSEVGPNSIAAKDGRIREGDRIVQINGRDVQDREEAVAALSSEDFRSLILLVARPDVQMEEVWLDDEHSDLLEELKREMLEEEQHLAEQSKSLEEDDITTDVATCSSNNQDSGTGRSDKSMQYKGCSKPAILAQVHKKLAQCVQDKQDQLWSNPRPQCVQTLVSGAHLNSLCPEVPEENDEDEEDEETECDHFQQLLELKCHIRNSGEYGLYYSRHSTIECSLSEQDGVGRELQLLNEELRSIELECQNIMQAHQLRKVRDPNHDWASRSQGCTNLPRGKLADINEHPEKSDKDSSSAYNTAESCRSTPLVMDRSPDHVWHSVDRSPDHSLQRRVQITNQKNLSRTRAACHSQPAAGPAATSSPEPSNPSESDQPIPADDEGCGQDETQVAPDAHLSPYHSSQHRHTNIPAHAQHYQSYMHLVQQRSAVEYAQSQLSLVAVEPKMEWKVKVRSDGTRYITKRPARDRILRERALKIREERSGMTTDDDAASELKLGRYWSKEERKQQLARAREQRRRREFMQRSRLECLREAPLAAAEPRHEVSIIELSHKKMMKRRNKKILDNWMTIQELMTHGAKAPDGAKVHNAFLSVTTV